MPETDENGDVKKVTMCNAVEYCRKNNNSENTSIAEQVFNNILNSLKISAMSEDAVTLAVDSKFILDSVKKMYLELLKEAFKETLGHEVDVDIIAKQQKYC